MNIELTLKENQYLLKLVMADLKRMDDLADHAVSHGTEIYLPVHSVAADIQMYLLNSWDSSKNKISDA